MTIFMLQDVVRPRTGLLLRHGQCPKVAAGIFENARDGQAVSEENAAFDLIGPKVEVRVQRAGVTLPIAEAQISRVETGFGFMPISPTPSRCAT